MRRVFDILAFVNGLVGLSYMALNITSITPENAEVHSAKAIVILVCVIVPYLIARSLEKLDLEMFVPRIVPARKRQFDQLAPETAQISYFDYLFTVDAPDKAPDAIPPRQSARGRVERHHTED